MLRIEPLPHKNWVAEAERLRGPVRAGRFLVHGAHDRGKVPAGRFTLEIDAGLAFGTAHHATTRGCLIALDRLFKCGRPRCVLDIGTGTGILAIAAARALNARRRRKRHGSRLPSPSPSENARKNGVRSRVSVVQAEGLAHPAVAARAGRSAVRQLAAQAPARPCSRLCPRRFARAGCACSPAFSRPKRGRSKRGFAPSASRSIRESFSMDGRRCCLRRRSTRRAPAD